MDSTDQPSIIMKACNLVLQEEFGFRDPQADHTVDAVHYFSDQRPSGRHYFLSIGYSEETSPLYYGCYHSPENAEQPLGAGGDTIEELVAALAEVLRADPDF